MATEKTRFLAAISSDEFQTAPEKLPIVLGNNTEGQLVLKDLAQLQHMIIAGASGSGKSTLTHEIILSLAYKLSPDKVRFLLCDTKTVEFLDYKEIPHLLSPPSSNMNQIVGEILWTHGELLRRLKLLAEYGVNNLDVYNDLAWEDFEEELPRIILVVDDAAQVLVEDGIADLVQQLCQNGRPVGIHVILVTQNPGLKKLAEIAKYHIPARVVCSRLNQTEENWLLGRKRREPLSNIGEFYFYDFFTHICVQLCSFDMICFQILNLVEQILLKYPPDQHKKQQVLEGLAPSDKDTPVYSDCDDELENLDGDEMLPAAVDIVLETGQASVSTIQRRLKVGYARAARLIDEMEEKGIVGPVEGSKPRKVLIVKDQPCSMRPEDLDEDLNRSLYTTSTREEEERMQRQKAHDEWREQMAKKLEQQAAKRSGQALPVAPESSTYCAHCGAKLSKEAAFCSACGASTKAGKAAIGIDKEMSADRSATITPAPAEKIEQICPYCGSRDVDVQLHQEVRGSKTITRTKSKYRQQRHGCLWWCIIGWWWWAFDLMFWVCFFPLRFLVQLFKKKEYTGKSKSVEKTKNDIAYRTVFLCKNCGHHWEEQK